MFDEPLIKKESKYSPFFNNEDEHESDKQSDSHSGRNNEKLSNKGKDHNDDRAGSTNDITPFTIEIFQQVNVLIKVEHENTPNRCLSLQLIHPRLNSKQTTNSPHIMKKRNI